MKKVYIVSKVDEDKCVGDRFCVGGALIEASEMVPHFGLAEAFDGHVTGVGPFDRGWPWYLHAGGLTSGNLIKGPTDYLDLEVGSPRKKYAVTFNPAIKALVVNHSRRELFVALGSWYPTIVANPEAAKGLPQRVVKNAFIVENLEKAMAHAYQVANTDKAILFDGSYGAINLTPALGEYLLDKAPGVSRKVDEELLPMWLKQRGIDPEEA